MESAARAEHAANLAEYNRQARLAQQSRDRERQRERQISDLHFRARQAEIWQQNADRAAYNVVQQRYRHTLMGELDAMINPPQPQPPPEPEREIVYVSEDEGSPDLGDRDFNVKAWMKKSRPWW